MGWLDKLVKSGVVNPQTGAVDYMDSPEEAGMALASAAAKTAQPGSVDVNGTLAEPYLAEGATMTPGPMASTTPAPAEMVTPPNPTAISYAPPPQAPQPQIAKPSFQQASTDATGQPAAKTPGLTRLGKLVQILGLAAKGGLAGQAAAEQSVLQSGGHRSGGFGTGFEAGITEAPREAMMKQQVERGGLQNEMERQQIATLPWVRQAQLARAQAEMRQSEAAIAANRARQTEAERAAKVPIPETPEQQQLRRQKAADQIGLTGDERTRYVLTGQMADANQQTRMEEQIRHDQAQERLTEQAQHLTARGQDMTDSRQRELNTIARETKQEQKATMGEVQLSGYNADMDRLAAAANELKNHPGLGHITGKWGVLPNIPGSEAANAQAKFDTLKSQIAFSVLQNLRNASKTGGALGQVSDREEKMLSENLAALERSQSETELKKSLQQIIDYTNASKERARDAFDLTYGKPSGKTSVKGEGSKSGTTGNYAPGFVAF